MNDPKYTLTVKDMSTVATADLLYHRGLPHDTRADLMCGFTKPDSALLNSHYVEVGTKVIDSTDDLAVCERLFELTNSPAPSDGGAFVEDVAGMARFWGKTHTSMSMGDVVRIRRSGTPTRFYLCASCGFERIGS